MVLLGIIILGTPFVLAYFREDSNSGNFEILMILAVLSALCFFVAICLSQAHPVAQYRLFLTSGFLYVAGLVTLAEKGF